jgi:subtilisin family serine protease
MWRRHLKTITCLSLCVCCLTASVFTFAQDQDNVTRKTSGNLSALLKATPTPTPKTIPTSSPLTVSQETGELDPRFKQKELLPLKFIFRTTSVPSFSEAFKKFVPTGIEPNAGDVGTQLILIAAASDAPARAAVDAKEVITIEIARPQTPGPIMTVGPRNLGARKSHHVEEFNAEFPNINGGQITAAIIDGGGILNTHVEFRVSPTNPTPNRVRVNTSAGAKEHPTHVAGTMAATGVAPKAKGMAPLLNLVSDDWEDDLTKLAALASQIHISNHSYGPISGWYREDGKWYWFGDRRLSGDEDAKFGKYSSEEAQLDEILFKFPNLITFIAAGNDRDDGPPIQPIQHFVIEGLNWVSSFDQHRVDGFDQGGLDTVTGLGLAKNAICIGAVDDITGTSGINMISYSGWGPADDGRIKPDLVANGHILNSTSNAGDDQYVDMSGTSMASPTAAGITGLIVELYQRERGARPSAAEIKGVLIHTAIDAGRKGPDATFGWGAIDALRAGRVVGQRTQSSFRHFITTDSVNAGATKEFVMNPNGTDDAIKVTLVWTDPAGAANLGGLDDATPALVNDLDLKLISPDGEEYFPYSLDRATPAEQARRDKPNKVDNVEVIEGVGALNGQWKVQIRGTNLRQGTNQRFALIVSGLRLP